MSSAKGYDLEWVGQQIKNCLVTNLGAQLAALDAEYNDGITLVMPHTNSSNSDEDCIVVGERAAFPRFPYVVIVPRTGNLYDRSGEQRYDMEEQSFLVNWAIYAEEREDWVLKRVSRSVRATQQVINANQDLDDSTGTIYSAIPYSKAIGNLLTDQQSGLLLEAQVGVRVGLIMS